MEYLVDHGASLSIRTLTQKTPVHLCFPLMMYINNPEIVNRYPEAFFDAVQRYDRESLRAFFKYVSNKEATLLRNDQGCSALHIAVKAGRSGSLCCERLTRRSREGAAGSRLRPGHSR